MDLPKRKHPRLKEYDYSQNGCYFITVCVKNRANILCTVGRDAHIPPFNGAQPIIELSYIGTVVDKYIENINTVYENISVDKYVIMPNHLHLLLSVSYDESYCGGMRASRPTINTVVRSMKTMVTKTIGYSIWQNSFYDEVIDNYEHYCGAWQYIDTNPLKWTEDEYYCK